MFAAFSSLCVEKCILVSLSLFALEFLIDKKIHLTRCSIYSTLFRAVDHKWDENRFATAGAQVDIWDHNRSVVIYFLRFTPLVLLR